MNAEPVQLPDPKSERAAKLRSLMSPERWKREVESALWRRSVVRGVSRSRRKGHGAQAACLRETAPDVHWSTFCHWRLLVATREGPEWERLLDGRMPPRRRPVVDPDVRLAAELLRRFERKIKCITARELLVAQFGPRGNLSDSSLYRIWRAAKLTDPAAGDPRRFEKVVRFSGGAALALVGAAAAESGVFEALAQSALEAGMNQADGQSEPRPPADPHEGRDERGRFTADYNHSVRQGVQAGEMDSRWEPDLQKRDRRDLGSLSVLSLHPETLAQRLLTMGMLPLVSSQRGFDAMDAPRAGWLKILGWRAYRPSTLDKTLAELGVLGVDEALWDAHGEQWAKKAKEWAQGGPAWLAIVRYFDITSEPYWTSRYARSGKVSRTGRVQPCLQRAMLTAGPGIPLWMSTASGTLDLKKLVRAMLEEEARDAAPGDDVEPEWITVMDAEAAAPALLAQLAALPRHRFVTVLKGQVLKGAKVEHQGLFLPYRGRDLVCEAKVVLRSGLELRGVLMERHDSQHQHRTLFVTDALLTELSTQDVADVYLSRWPNQESIFREARHGAGLERSHGFSGEYVTHVALHKKQETARKQVARSEKELEEAQFRAVDTHILSLAVEDPLLESVALEAAKQAGKKVKEADKRHRAALQEKEKQQVTPGQIFRRDTTRENIATALNMSVMLLVEWVLREYFGGLKMELQTFLNYFLYLPVEVRTSWKHLRYRIEIGDLPGEKAGRLSQACDVINRREIRRFGRKMTFEVVSRLDQNLGQQRE